MSKTAIEVHDLTVTYDRKPVLWSVDFELPAGHMVGVMGPNGSGKSTLLKTVMGILSPMSGWVKVFNEPIDNQRGLVSYMPQRQSVDWDFPASVKEVVSMGRYVKKKLFHRLNKEDHQIIEDSLKKVGMWDFRNRQISQLSGGQQQRVFIARAMARQSEIYLLDEPFAGVDAATEQSIFQILLELKQEGKTIVVVHHDLYDIRHFDHLVLLNTRLVASGDPNDIYTEENLRKTFGARLDTFNQILQKAEQEKLPIRHD